MSRAVPPPNRRLTLRSDALEVVLLPERGAEPYAIVDRATGLDLLFKTPWGWRDARDLPPFGSSEADFLARYLGGWSVLLPNAGPERTVEGALRGFHGEAALSPWRVEAGTANSATVTVELVTAPLSVTRTLAVDGPSVVLDESVTNTSGVPTRVAWVHHPVFGLPFAGHPARITAGARRLVTDATSPGDTLPADTVLDFPVSRLSDGSVRDIGALPPPDQPRSVFAALTDFDSGEFTIVNSDLHVGVRVEWDTAVFPYAWVWQECHASPGYPWFGRAFAVAIEPANVLPGFGTAGRADAPVLEPHATWSTTLRLTRFDP